MTRGEIRPLGHEPALDGVRGAAIAFVMVWHFGPVYNEGPLRWFTAGHIAIDLFFALSGFLITALLLREQRSRSTIQFGAFYQRRFFRLLPALFVFLLGHLIFALTTDISSAPLSPGTELSNEIPTLLFSQFFILNQADHLMDFEITLGMGHMWSLAVEEQFYLVWPSLIFVFMAARNLRQRIIGAVAAVGVGITANAYLWENQPNATRVVLVTTTVLTIVGLLAYLETRHHDAWVVGVLATIILGVNVYKWGSWETPVSGFNLYSNTIARADQLLLGAMLAVLWTGGWIPRRAPAVVTALGWSYYLYTMATADFTNSFFALGGWTSTGLAATLIVWGSLDGGGAINGRILGMRWLKWMGKVSYSLYLWHGLFLEVAEHVVGDQSVLVRAAVGLSLSFGAAILSWRLVEQPLMAFNSRRQAASRAARGESARATL